MGPSRTPPGTPGTLDRGGPSKSADAYRTIGEVAEALRLPQHVLRFWETRFPQIKPMKRAGGRRFYKPEDVALLRAVQALLYDEGYTIKGVQRLLAEFGARHVAEAHARSRATPAASASRLDAPGDPSRVETGAGGDIGRGEPSGQVPDQAGPEGRATGERQVAPRDDWVEGLNAVLDDLRECARLIASVRAKEL